MSRPYNDDWTPKTMAKPSLKTVLEVYEGWGRQTALERWTVYGWCPRTIDLWYARARAAFRPQTQVAA